MSVTSQAGTFGYGLNDNGDKNAAVQNWYRAKAMTVGMGPVIEAEVAPPEISGGNLPTGAYKSGTYFGGRIAMQPRLEGDFGWLLLAAAGQCVTVPHDTQAGVYIHTFSYQDNNAMYLPFFGVRRIIPGRDTTVDEGEIGTDCIMSALTMNFPQVGPLSMDMDIMGMDWVLDSAPDLWNWVDVPEPYDSVPMVMSGSGLVLPNWAPGGGQKLPITGARVTMANNTTSPQEERIIGSYFPDDYTVRQRSLNVEMTYKWNNPDLYRMVINGNDVEDIFKPCLTYTDLELEVLSPCPIDPGVIDYPYKLKISAPRMFWQMQPVQLQGDSLLQLQVVGTAIESLTGLPQDYFKIELHNTQPSYIIPSA